MAEERFDRKLAAILAADVAGYSRLVRHDEEGTRATLRRHLADIFEPRIARHRGRVFKTTGDGLLAEFASVVDAVRCAVDIQAALASHGGGGAGERGAAYRIAVNLGDVIAEGDDLHGDGVNIAARLQELAVPGGICVPENVVDQVRDRLEVGFEDLGPRRLKNIDRPVRAYHVIPNPVRAGQVVPAVGRSGARRRWAVAAAVALVALAGGGLWWRPWAPPEAPASIARMAFPLPDKPSIAVLPFENLGDAPGPASLGDGLADNIIASLSQIPNMFVIARNSTFSYRGRAVKVQKVAEELGVRYVLEGSVQRAGSRARITAQLVDALTGYQLWSGRYDREVNDIFAFQDEITLNVVTALQVELTDGELARLRRQGTTNLEAWLLVSQAVQKSTTFTKEDNARARELARKAIALDSNFAQAWLALAWTHLFDFQAGWTAERGKSLKRCVELVQRSLELNDSYPRTYSLLGLIHLFLNQHATAAAYLEKALSLSPNDAWSMVNLAMVKSYAGRADEAIPLVRRAMRLSPYYPDWFLGELGRGYLLTGLHDAAIQTLEQRLRRNPDSGEGQILLAAAYSAAGETGKARGTLDTFLRARPAYSLSHYAEGEFYANPADLERVLNALRKAGMPE